MVILRLASCEANISGGVKAMLLKLGPLFRVFAGEGWFEREPSAHSSLVQFPENEP